MVKQTLTDSNGQTVKEQTYQYDNTGNLVKRQTQGISQFPQLTASYQYDGLDRLTQESYDLFPERNASYTFDANSNRLTRKQGQDANEISEIYRYAQNSNRIIDKDVLRQDAQSLEPVKEIEYDAKQRIQKLYLDGKLKAEYRYDAQNLRAKKTLYNENGDIAEEIYYHYDQNGLLISESDGQGETKRNYVYLDGTPIAQIDTDGQGQDSIVYLHTDHLATPRLATNQNQMIVWRWESDAYGAISPQGSVTVTINLRYPGQYADQESGWFYNWNRYYDSGTGRYWTSDPIGLVGGSNTFLYVGANPLMWIDNRGLREECKFEPLSFTYSPAGKFRLVIDKEWESSLCGPVAGFGSPTPPGFPTTPPRGNPKPSPFDWVWPPTTGKCQKFYYTSGYMEQLYEAWAWGVLSCYDCNNNLIDKTFGLKRWEAADEWRKVEGSDFTDVRDGKVFP